MATSLSIRSKLLKQKRHWSFLLLLTFSMQAMFAKGLMPGNGTWVEMCIGDSAGVSLVYLSGSSDYTGNPEHQAEAGDHCLFSALSIVALQKLESTLRPLHEQVLVSADFHPYANRQFWPARLSRAPPNAIG